MTVNYGKKYFNKSVIFRPHNVYGPNMGWEHVIPNFITKINESILKKDKDEIHLEIQGSGNETRAFIYIDDFIEGLNKILQSGENLNVYNIGSSEEITIKELAKKIGNYYGKNIKVVTGKLQSGSTKRRCPDISKISKLGFSVKYSLEEGIKLTAKWYEKNLRN